MALQKDFLARVAAASAASIAAALLLLAGAASAQGLYRSVGPDGRITYSDRAPATPAAKSTVERRLEPSSSIPSATLPYDLREVTSRYPVTLYTAPDCAPCASGRVLLSTRGIPFIERTVSSNDDITALKALSGDGSLPFVTVGSQQLRGFSEQEWQRNLDAAGYPKTSQLPANWRTAAATPLAPRAQAAAPAAAPVAPEANANGNRASSDSARSGNNNNPAGIRF